MGKFQKRYTKDQLIYLSRFTVTMAADFFDSSPRAFRRRERDGEFIDEHGIKIEPVRLPSGARRYSLNDLRLIAHSLRRQNYLTTPQFTVIINRIDAFSTPVKQATGGRGRARSIYSDKS